MEIPNDGSRAATMADIPTIVQFPDESGYTVKYVFDDSNSTGAYSKLFLKGSTLSVQAVGLYSLNADGVMSLTKEDCLGTTADRDVLCPENDNSFFPSQLLFRVKEDTLKAGKSATSLVAVNSSSWTTTNPVIVRKSSDVVGNWKWTKAEVTTELELYADLKYVKTTIDSGEKSIETGAFDIQADRLITVTDICIGSCFAANFYSAILKAGQLLLTSPSTAKTDTLLSNGDLPIALKTADLVGEWKSFKTSGNDTSHIFMLGFESNNSMTLKAWDAGSGEEAYADEGTLQIVGSLVVLNMNTGARCTGNSTIGIMNGNTLSCYSYIVSKAVIDQGEMTFENEYIPSQWTQQ